MWQHLSSPVVTLAVQLLPLAPLAGEWEAEPDENGVLGGSRFTVEAGGRALLRTSWATYPATADRPAGKHEDVLLVHVEGDEAVALYVDNEGHVIRYAVSVDGARIVFTSDGAGARFRLTYDVLGTDRLDVRFDVAAPGRDLAPYVRGSLRRVG